MPQKILVTEDSPTILEITKNILEAGGYSIATAANGKEALEKAAQDKPDLIILDVMMPPPNGYQVCRKLKDDPQFKRIPVILLTARSTESDEFWGMESGADAYVTKPFNAEDLLEKVKILLDKKKG